jgi:DNA-binding transcriptional MerR regulator
MDRYGVRDVERLLRLPRATIRAFVSAGFVSPTRGPRNTWLFSFRDLIVLRTAQALISAHIPPRRITKSVKELRRHLPQAMPLSGLSVGAVGDQVVVNEGSTRWQADSGQYLLEFGGDPAKGSLNVIERAPEKPAPNDARELYENAVALEEIDRAAAIRAYERAIAADPRSRDARINLGRLLHEGGHGGLAERCYREAIAVCGPDAVLSYNLGVLLDDMGRKTEAMEAYRSALRANPALADGHYNLALLFERFGRRKEAIRHMSEYRRLVAATGR